MESSPRLGIDLLTLISASETITMMIAPPQEFQWTRGRFTSAAVWTLMDVNVKDAE